MILRTFSRRDFMKGLAVGGAAVGSASLLTACGQAGQTEENTGGTETANNENMAAVAVVTELKIDLGGMNEAQYVWIGDEIYYLEDYEDENGWIDAEQYSWLGEVYYSEDDEAGPVMGNCSRLKVRSVDGTGEAVVLDETEGRYICALFEGTQSDMAMIIAEYSEEDEVWKYYLTQADLTRNEVSRTELTDMEGTAGYITQAAMDEEGNVAYITTKYGYNSYAEAWCHLILKDGTCVNDLEIGDGNVSAGMTVLKLQEEGLYLTEQYSLSTRSHKELQVWKIDFPEKKLIQAGSMDVSDILTNTTEDIRLLTDGERIYLTTEDTLYLCGMESWEREELLRWTDEFVNVDGSKIGAIRTTGTGYEALLSVDTDTAKLVCLTWTDSSLLSSKKTVIIATSNTVSLSAVVQRFNESSTEYHAELVQYSADELSDDLIYHSDVVPDVYDMRAVDVTVLEGLDLLEDLEPYFEASEVVSREDILDSVWEAGMVNGKMVGIVTEFRIGTLYSSAEEISLDGWSLEDMISLCGTYPESDLIAWYSYEDILEMIAMTGGLDEYVDWENLTCSFDSEGFMNLLEKLTEIRYPENDDKKVSYGVYGITDDFLAQESLLANSPYIGSLYDYCQMKTLYGAWSIVGYPTVTGEEAWYRLYPVSQFGIYSNSENKEGAWAFIEFLLSESEQTWYAYDAASGKYHYFPVRQDAFDAYLHRSFGSDGAGYLYEPTEEDIEAVKSMVEHSHMKSYLLRTEIWDIILEEIPYYYEGAKSLKDVVGLIQNRCSLYLSEME